MYRASPPNQLPFAPVFDRLGRWAGVAFAAAFVLLNQSVRGQISETGGVVVFETENYTANLSPRLSPAHSWTPGNAVTGFSGIGYMEALPNDGTPGAANSTAPELQFTVNFSSAGTHYVWIRGHAATTNDDSVYAGIDGASSIALALTQTNAWNWSNTIQGGAAGASINVPTTGNHTINLWMREDGLRMDRVLLTTTATFSPTVGNVWHIPNHAEPTGVVSMRTPFTVTAGSDVTIYSGNQFQGGTGSGNQLGTGSTVFYRKSTDPAWSSVAMTFNVQAANNKYYTATVPGATFASGDTIQYYFKIPYSDHLPTFVYGNDTQSSTSDLETVAQAAPFRFVVQDFNYWQGQNIYQILTDRFFDGDSSNNNADGNFSASASKAVHGGDFKGIEQKLDYIKSLGATAIWVSPVVKNTAGQYHGYAGLDFYSVDPHFGSMTDLQHMVNAAHARGIQVIDDIVLNHGGDLVYSTDAGYPNFKAAPGYTMKFRNNAQQYPPPFDLNATNPKIESLFHNNGNIQDFGNTTQVETGDLRGLDDLKTETTYVRSNLRSIYKFWIEQAGFDGFRIDTVKHVEAGCWQYWSPLIHADAVGTGKPNFFTFGECEDGSDAKVGSYTGIKSGGAYELDSEVDYPLYFMVNGIFAQANANSKQLEDHYNAIAANYDAPAQNRLVTFLDNHDKTRFLNSANANNNVARLNLALAFLYTSRGIPCLYYGTEQAFNGGADPSNREDMFAGGWEPGASVGDNFNMTHNEFQLVAKLNNFRRLYPTMSLGTYINQWNSPNGPGLFAYTRRLGLQEIFVAFNTAGTTQTLPARSTIYPVGTPLVNLLNPAEMVTVGAGPQIPALSIPGTTAKIFIAQSLVQPLDPVVTAITPAHDGSNIATSASVVMTFSKPMDTASVQSAFSTSPATAGTFSWSPLHDVLTYTPNDPGWPGSTLMSVRIAPAAADAVSGKNFYAAFETRFKTTASTFSDTTAPALLLNSPIETATVSGQISVSGNASDNIAVQRVEIQLDGGDWTTATGTSSWSFALDTSNFLNGTHAISARAIDTSGNISNLNTSHVRFVNVPGAYVQRISAGNDVDTTDCNALIWARDQPYSLGSFGFTAGVSGFIANSITGACASAQSIYQHDRSSAPNSTVRYLFNCPAGIYQVTLFEAETIATGPNQRVFNVSLEGQQILSNFDIYTAAGGANTAWSQSSNTTVADAQLDLQFTPLTGNARISGIQVQKTGDVFSDTDGLPDWWRLAYFDHAVGEDGDNSRAGEDADGDGRSNLQEYLSGTDPRDASSVFAITKIGTSGSDIEVFWNSVAGKTYQLQRAISPNGAPMWSNVGAAVSAVGLTSNQTDTGAAQDPVHFYRVVIP